MDIFVSKDGWGDARPADIHVLLANTASHLLEPLRTPVEGAILVVAAPITDAVPRTPYRTSTVSPFVIQLTARGRSWSQYAYQFSHELCHVVSDYENLSEDNPNRWFHEAVCELASVFCLRRMAERWPVDPPYPNWAPYATSLADYAEDLLRRQERQLPPETTLPDWLASREEALRSDPYQRNMNATVAYSLLPVFEDSPEGWNSIRHLPNSRGSLVDYIGDWHSAVLDVDRAFVLRVLDRFLSHGH